ncbi:MULTISPECIES: nucleoside 2-deoxyribosyltransferase [Marinobacter]|jgi:nucleoside 2-deoxyribosyltransferase|uniref:Nucleoside 2-deoxyribosyltransferase n=1 Tax=Marinobacter excellens LAMA 842 TaxID=1306954 RepID=A0A137S206_9GAMM|nr:MULTISPECIES: nucleoside 2-deoxyribosyltransferase [Marinobacter]KXO06467.1 Nucleoside 2-deoxyribosyltransferase [Marinobacter excellens LAMA 842]MCD1629126.1 nucleoside 2-deoxyribosyltransferase [Marinobacter shengliensis]
MQKTKRIYLAGPEVFFPAEEHQAIVAEKKRLLRNAGFEGADPLDTALEFSDEEAKHERGHRIYQANRELMDSCDAIIANLTPFRGISADPGTVFEVGYMIGQGKPAFGFTLDSRLYQQRAGATCQDELGHTIEDFEMSDNLMIEGGIRESGGQLFVAQQSGEHRFFSAEMFNRCVRALAHT